MDTNHHVLQLRLFGHDRLFDLVQDPLWYLHYKHFNQLRIIGAAAVNDNLMGASKHSRERLYTFFDDYLDHGYVALGQANEGLYEWDSEREPVTTVVIHHSARPNGIDLGILSAMELLRLYVPAYVTPAPDDKPRVKNKPIYSGHFSDGRQYFYPYHWLIRQDGTSIRLLNDSQVGWHCGDWEVNKQSVALCFDADLIHSAPNDAMLAEARRILRTEYRWADASCIRGHSDVTDTACPGDQFTDGVAWKTQLTD